MWFYITLCYDKPRQHIKKTDISLPTKVCVVQGTVFPVVMYGCKSWTIKKAEHRRIDAFELWCQKRLLRVPWTERWSNQSILKEINPEYSLEGLILKLKLQYFGHLMQRADSLEKTLMLGKSEGRTRMGQQEMRWATRDEMVGWHHWLNGHEFEQTLEDSEGQRSLACCSPRGRKRVGHNLATEAPPPENGVSSVQPLLSPLVDQRAHCFLRAALTLSLKRRCHFLLEMWGSTGWMIPVCLSDFSHMWVKTPSPACTWHTPPDEVRAEAPGTQRVLPTWAYSSTVITAPRSQKSEI